MMSHKKNRFCQKPEPTVDRQPRVKGRQSSAVDGVILMFIMCLLFNSVSLIGAGGTIPVIENGTPAAIESRFRPKGFNGKLTAFNLNREVRLNERKAADQRSYNYSSFLVKEFSGHYYQNQEFQWHRVGGSLQRNVGICKSGENKIKEVYLSWISLSDSLQWGFFNAEIERTTKADQFTIIADHHVANAIRKSMLDRRLMDDLQDITHVFRYRTRTIITEQRSANLKFPAKAFLETKYGVVVGGKVHFFTAQGKKID